MKLKKLTALLLAALMVLALAACGAKDGNTKPIRATGRRTLRRPPPDTAR